MWGHGRMDVAEGSIIDATVGIPAYTLRMGGLRGLPDDYFLQLNARGSAYRPTVDWLKCARARGLPPCIPGRTSCQPHAACAAVLPAPAHHHCSPQPSDCGGRERKELSVPTPDMAGRTRAVNGPERAQAWHARTQNPKIPKRLTPAGRPRRWAAWWSSLRCPPLG